MKKAYNILVLLLLISCTYNNEHEAIPLENLLDRIQKSNTLYLLHQKEDISKLLQINAKTKDTASGYFFYLNDKSYVKLIKQRYLDFDRYKNREEAITIEKPKSFLKEHKPQIITTSDFDGYADNKSKLITALLNNKKIYLIDERDFKDDSIIIREVNVFTSLEYMPEE